MVGAVATLALSMVSIVLAPAASAQRLPGSMWLNSPSTWGQAWNECRRVYPQTKSTRKDGTDWVSDWQGGKWVDKWFCYDTP